MGPEGKRILWQLKWAFAGAQSCKRLSSQLEQALPLVAGDGFRQPGFGSWGWGLMQLILFPPLCLGLK